MKHADSMQTLESIPLLPIVRLFGRCRRECPGNRILGSVVRSGGALRGKHGHAVWKSANLSHAQNPDPL
jgi:hypothetical protein